MNDLSGAADIYGVRRPLMLLVMAVAVTVLPSAAHSTAESASLVPQLQTDLDSLVQSMAVPGAQLIRTEGDQVLQLNSGVGDLTTRSPFPDLAQVRIASNTKSFVATVLLQLVAEGRLELDAPVELYLPGVVRGPGGDGNLITVRNLLQHTSGIPDYLDQLPAASVADLQRSRPAAELIRLGLDQNARFAPGSESRYSNTNYLIAGKLIEQLTGRPAGLEITTRILIPLGLRDTYWPAYPLENVIRGPHPRGYHSFDGPLVDITDIDPGWGLSDGAMVASGADLNRFFMALLSGQLVPPAQLAEMERTVPAGAPRVTEDAGLGLFRRITSCGIETWGHGGAMNGYYVVNAATAERAVTVSVNQLPGFLTLIAHQDAVHELLDEAICG
ncbi:serine hydrolase domain-containing protein [Nocardia sp. NPDC052566]|uniref:serine hydrolase domain-containing protein n=1 Tax=Nocardia sp. NPDC052566 TaxID=3364330 RepID=UPI0037C76257